MDITTHLKALEDEKARLEHRLAEINLRLKSVYEIVTEVLPEQLAAPAGKSTGDFAPGVTETIEDTIDATKTPHRWFKEGQAARLLKRVAKKPIRQADAVRALAEVHLGGQPTDSDEMQRFRWAVLSAMKAGVARGELKKRKGGVIVAA